MRLKLLSIAILAGNVFGVSQNNKTTVFFDFDQSELDKQSQVTLNSLISKADSYRFLLRGYTDSVGSLDYNYKLSQQRVESVRQYLLQQGVDSTFIIEFSGNGESVVYDTDNKNRRVDVFLEGARKTKPILIKDTLSSSEILDSITPIQHDTIVEPDLAISIMSLAVGEKLPIKNLEFMGGRSILLPKSESTLNDLLKVMQDNPTLKIELQGHICCNKSWWQTRTREKGIGGLSKARAKTVYKYLIENGIDKSRLSYKGFGSSRPLTREEKKKTGQKSNRRVEVLIVEK